MDDSCPLGIAAGSNGSQYRCDAGTDILAEQDINRTGQADQSAVGQRLQNADRSGGRLDDRCKNGAGQDPKQGIGKPCHQIDKRLGIPQRSHGGTHHIHTDEQHPKARHDPPDGMEFRIFKKYNQNHAGKSDQGRQRAYIQRNQKAGDGCADIGSHDDPGCLGQCHHTGIDKSHHHNGSG